MNSSYLNRTRLVPTLLLTLALWLALATFALAQGPVPTTGTDTQQIEPGQTPAGLTAAEWDGIQAQLAADRYRPRAADAGGYLAANPAHGWRIGYNPDGATTLTGDGTWDWGLRLTGYGYGLNRNPVDHPTGLTTTQETLTYRWDANLSEWWINSPNGLEQGFTLQQRPDGAASDEALTVAMAVYGDLTPQQRGDGIAFTDDAGTTILTYNKLHVTDAAGQVIPAHFAVTGNQLQVFVDDAAAVYPLTIDPLVQQAYLKASNTGQWDAFGDAVAIDGDTLVVGAYGEDNYAGAAYVFVYDGTNWSQQAYLKASNTGANDYFGRAVAIDGDTVVVGAYLEDSNNGAPSGDELNASGAAYVFVYAAGFWTEQALLKAPIAEADEYFGAAVAVSGDTVVVGAYGKDTGVVNAGAAYVFVRDGPSWSQQAYLKASNTGAGDYFGRAVAISGDTVVVGAYQEDSNATGIDGDDNNNSATDSGAAYVFVRDDINWSQQAYLKASNTENDDQFGYAVTISGDTVVVGAPLEDSSTTGVNSTANNLATDAGAAYVFEQPPAPNVSLSKTVTPTSEAPYQGIITYTVVLSNTGGSDDSAVVLTDTLPGEVDFARWINQSGATVAGDEITWRCHYQRQSIPRQ